ncbi:single-strand binding protein [Arthrobacter crystallopoietes BAB-32]|uniref:Single-stranded DNA-binding protein n=1 Tax=Arthrobacter crystallopoietes BAB-32 TaxID=1246476 RepID=N1V4J4_9MICC|nr:single-stranded DNA-binding protein [Arthrobacter crystallopoietes]EMY34997.1 single-strand binding protein [Arthrobacter crystallopoietes BAB-32]
MSGTTMITVIGNLTADPELRFTPSGSAVTNFTIASTPRTYDSQTGQWKDAETLFLRASIWREAAEHAAESLTKGTRVVAHGTLKPRTYETRAGEKRTVIELEVEELGASLRYHPVTVHRQQRQPAKGSIPHPADDFRLPPNQYSEDAWFGIEANPSGRIIPDSQKTGNPPAEEPVFKGLALPSGTLSPTTARRQEH